jgi:hypothetical protein
VRIRLAMSIALLAACSTRDARPADTAAAPDSAAARADQASPSRRDSTRPAPAPTPAEPPTRRDGEATNPPIHRTNPRDEDVMNPGGGTGPEALLAQIHALVKPGGCAREGDCRTLPVGRKACGGPRSYVVYCATTTDIAALKRKIAELDAADRAAAANGAVSDCSLALEPKPVLSGGVCRAESAVAAP